MNTLSLRTYALLGLAIFACVPLARAAAIGDALPALEADGWLNTPHAPDLKSRVVLVEFWTHGCWNCRNVEPYLKQWYARYREQGLTVVGVHSPEFPHERDIGKVRDYTKKNAIAYPVAIDNDYDIWEGYANQYWPALYLADRSGRIRYTHIGEGRYAETEAAIQTLLAE
jgi:thiol-disulfide isomerase/thioredoxin